MDQHYNDLLYGNKKFVIDNDSLHILNDSFDADMCRELRADTGIFKETTSRDYICDMKDSSFSIKDKLLELGKRS